MYIWLKIYQANHCQNKKYVKFFVSFTNKQKERMKQNLFFPLTQIFFTKRNVKNISNIRQQPQTLENNTKYYSNRVINKPAVTKTVFCPTFVPVLDKSRHCFTCTINQSRRRKLLRVIVTWGLSVIHLVGSHYWDYCYSIG